MFNNRTGLSLFFVLFLLVRYISAFQLPTKQTAKPVAKPAAGKVAPKTTSLKTTPATLPKTAPVKTTPANTTPAKTTTAKTGPKTDSKTAPCPSKLGKRGGTILLGYNGFNGTPRSSVVVSRGRELGAVFHIADSIDLAKSLAHGADASKDYICTVYADDEEWKNQRKVWLSNPVALGGASAVNSAYMTWVLFAPHTAAGLPAGSPSSVNQMGIRQAQVTTLGVAVQCFPKSCFANSDHNTLNYDRLGADWEIIQEGRQ